MWRLPLTSLLDFLGRVRLWVRGQTGCLRCWGRTECGWEQQAEGVREGQVSKHDGPGKESVLVRRFRPPARVRPCRLLCCYCCLTTGLLYASCSALLRSACLLVSYN